MWSILLVLLLPCILAQPGFVNLDCGGQSNFTDDSGLFWSPDHAYISTGSVTTITNPGDYPNVKLYQTIRYFPGPVRKHCYKFPTLKNATYLFRASFVYSNYDGQNSAPIFSLLVDSNTYYRDSMDDVVVEIVALSSSTSMDFCLGNTSSTVVPFISYLQQIQLNSVMYNIGLKNGGLVLISRMNAGGTRRLMGYPDDKYGRRWQVSIRLLKYSNISIVAPNSADIPDNPPLQVLQTAVTGDSIDINYYSLDSGKYYAVFYFAQSVGDRRRQFHVDIQDVGTSLTKTFWELNATRPWLELVGTYDVKGPDVTFNIGSENSSENASTTTILNGFELYQVVTELFPGTDTQDRSALTELQRHFDLLAWSGDPCLPDGYGWDWVGCDVRASPARVTSLNLSNMGLNSSIPAVISSLAQLTQIRMDNNSLYGDIPDLSLLKNLNVLSIENNPMLCVTQAVSQNVVNVTGRICDTSKSKTLVAAIVSSGIICIGLIGFGFGLFIYLRRRKRLQTTHNHQHHPGVVPFSYEEIMNATKGLQTKLGEGGFGYVSYGVLPSGKEIAVKVHSEKCQGRNEFDSEIGILSVIHHRNVVPFVGYCTVDNQLMLVYEYMPNHTLRGWLSSSAANQVLDWEHRLSIALGAAKGLEYLHEECMPNIIHRDVKSTNILLDRDFTAKIADFGLSKAYSHADQTHLSTVVKGTPGYLDPEYHLTGMLTKKSDVFSFGVVLYELISGSSPIIKQGQTHIATLAREHISGGDLQGLMDPKLHGDYELNSAWKVAEIALICTEAEATNRPTMTEVVAGLKEAIVLLQQSKSLKPRTSVSILQSESSLSMVSPSASIMEPR